MAREEDLKRSGAWDWELLRPKEPRKNEEQQSYKQKRWPEDRCPTPADEIIELTEEHYGSGKAMQVADILKEGE